MPTSQTSTPPETAEKTVTHESGRPRGLPWYANADIEVAGVTICAGDLVLHDLQDANMDANMDAQRFPMPEAFDVARVDNPHVAFGHGPYFCISALLARLELRALFGTLLQHFPTLRLAVPVERLRPRSHLLTGGLAALPVTW